MILPFLFAFGLFVLGMRGKIRTLPELGIREPTVGGAVRVPHGPPLTGRYRAMLKAHLVRKMPVTRWLIDNAILEAFRDGDMRTVMMLSQAVKRRTPASEKHDASEKQEMETEPTDMEGAIDVSKPQSTEPPSELSDLGQPSLKSPIDGVEDEDWMEFVVRLRTKPPGFQSDKYLGQYEQNKSRLKQLDLPDPKTPDEEYEVLVRDIATHARDSAALIVQWSGDVVNVNGADHPVCQSGILGLLKSAGHEGAKSWLTNPADRAKYPKTTEAFLRTNECF